MMAPSITSVRRSKNNTAPERFKLRSAELDGIGNGLFNRLSKPPP
jgi:hypothetical protein